jgi:hypothetical protein
VSTWRLNARRASVGGVAWPSPEVHVLAVDEPAHPTKHPVISTSLAYGSPPNHKPSAAR